MNVGFTAFQVIEDVAIKVSNLKARWVLFVGVLSLLSIGCSSPAHRVTVEKLDANDAAIAEVVDQSQQLDPVSNAIQTSLPPKKDAVQTVKDGHQDTLDALFYGDPVRWKTISEEDGITTFEDLESSGDVIGFRGKTVINAPIKKIATILNKLELRSGWVDSLIENRVVSQQSSFERIEYNHTKVPWPFQDRDFVYRVTVSMLKKPNAMLIRMFSVDDPNEPPHEGIVRGKIKRSYYYLRETTPGTTEIVIEMALNPEGAIPKWLSSLTQKKWPHQTLFALRKMANDPQLQVTPDIERYFSMY